MGRVQRLWATISMDVIDGLVAHARHRLLAEMGLPPGDPVEVPDAAGTFERVQVNLVCGGTLRAAGAAKADTLVAAVERAVRRLTRDASHGGLPVIGEVAAGTLEVLIQTGSRQVKGGKVSRVRRRFSLGLHGLELRHHGKRTAFDPTVPLRAGWTLKQALAALGEAAGLGDEAWADPEHALYVTDWLHFAEAPERRVVELYRGRLRARQRPTHAHVAEAMRLCARRLITSQRGDGAYTYIVDARTGELSNADFNTVRMCGSTYAMTRATDRLPAGPERQAVIRSADRGVRYLLERRTEMADVPGAWFIADRARGPRRQYGKLGATALALFSLQFGPFTQRFAAERAQLVETILALQDPSGRFRVHLYGLDYEGERRPEKPNLQNYFPGEALIALFHEWRNSGEPRVLKAIRDAFPYYRKHFRDEPDTAFLLWQTDAWRSMAEYFLARPHAPIPGAPEPDEVSEYVDFVFEQVDWLLAKQHTAASAPFEDYVGGFFNTRPAPGSVTGVVCEPVIRALGLAARVGDEARIERYREAARLGLIFLSRLQLKPEEAFQTRRPELALGGVTTNLTNFNLRNDADQHAITCWIAALETPALGL